jgi:FMN phosphatase YigB (HAD superfamily)
MDRFLPGYFQALGEALSHLGSPDRIIQQVHHAVQKMVANQDPGKTLKAVFAEHFYEPLGTTQEACDPIIRGFYKDQYPLLKPITTAKPQALELGNWCYSRGITMAIATNPLFPYTATCQRVQWAGLEPQDFAFITSYDDFHFTKPNLTYYAEVLGRLGWPEGRIVMVGDDPILDLLPMENMGYDTFWVHQGKHENNRPDSSLSEVIPWLKQLKQHNDPLPSNRFDVSIAILRSTPAVLDTWLRQTPVNLRKKTSSTNNKEFVKLLEHIADFEIKVIQPTCEQIKSDPLMKVPLINDTHDHDLIIDSQQNPEETFIQFLEARRKSLSLFESNIQELNYENLHLAEHSYQSKISHLIGFIAQHDRFHLHQIANLLNICKIN